MGQGRAACSDGRACSATGQRCRSVEAGQPSSAPTPLTSCPTSVCAHSSPTRCCRLISSSRRASRTSCGSCRAQQGGAGWVGGWVIGWGRQAGSRRGRRSVNPSAPYLSSLPTKSHSTQPHTQLRPPRTHHTTHAHLLCDLRRRGVNPPPPPNALKAPPPFAYPPYHTTHAQSIKRTCSAISAAGVPSSSLYWKAPMRWNLKEEQKSTSSRWSASDSPAAARTTCEISG